MMIVYSKPNCPACVTLKKQLDEAGKDYAEIVLGVDMPIEEFKEKFPKVRSVPYVDFE